MLNIPTALVTSRELTWREDSVSPALMAKGQIYLFVTDNINVRRRGSWGAVRSHGSFSVDTRNSRVERRDKHVTHHSYPKQ
jgi:hypothetical protein